MRNGRPEARIPSLDGLRALSIAGVLIGHLAGTRGFPLPAAAGNFLNLGELGVRVFFVISGFLITGLLLAEVERTGRVHLGWFYFRRTFRIFPPYYAFLGCLVFAQAAGRLNLASGDLLHALTYTSNYDAVRSWFVGHTWSLSVEEQFYLLWPAVLLLAGRRKALGLAAAALLAVPVIRLIEWELFRSSTGDGIGQRFETVADAIAFGCVLAGSRTWLHGQTWYRRLLDSPRFVVIPIAAFAANLTHDHPLVYFAVAATLVNAGTALTIDWCVTRPESGPGRLLNSRALVFAGVLSYSIYLWQQPFLNRASGNDLAAFPLNVTLAVAAALASYYLIETPALTMRRRIERYVGSRSQVRPAAATAALSPDAAA